MATVGLVTGWRRGAADGLLWVGLCALLPLNGEGLSEPNYLRWLLVAGVAAAAILTHQAGLLDA